MERAHELWGITAYFNPLHYRRRVHNYHIFRRHLPIPLVAVELGYDGQFDLQPGDAEILLQYPGHDVMWQKERLLNLALEAVPAGVARVICLDSDIILERRDWPAQTCQLLDEFPLVQPFSHAHNLQRDATVNFPAAPAIATSAPALAFLLQEGVPASALCNAPWPDLRKGSPCIYGHALAFRRSLFERGGFYDSCIVGGGDRAMCFAGCDLLEPIAESMHFNARMREHFLRWAAPWAKQIQGRWGCVPGDLFHLWHGDLPDRKYRQRYREFAHFDFDPDRDVAKDEYGSWRWSSDKPALHAYLADYFVGRQEDGPLPHATDVTVPYEESVHR